jgi:hypothetical protein
MINKTILILIIALIPSAGFTKDMDCGKDLLNGLGTINRCVNEEVTCYYLTLNRQGGNFLL